MNVSAIVRHCLQLSGWLCLGLVFSCPANAQDIKIPDSLPAEVVAAFEAAKTAKLYSLEPAGEMLPQHERLHNERVLGDTTLTWEQTATAFRLVKKGVAEGFDRLAFCFSPRHALRVTTREHHYDLVICFECVRVDVYRDQERLSSVGLTASPEYFNALLKAGRVPLSDSSYEVLAKEEKYYSDREARWLSAMPESIRPVWTAWQAEGEKRDLKKLQVLLAKQFPKAEDRILALFAWYAQDDRWPSNSNYASAPRLMLEEYGDADFVTVGQRDDFTTAQLEGAARYLVGWPTTRLAVLPAKLKQKLLAHVTNQKDAQKIAWARHAFGQK
ncbi:hypothetical protein [Verrucomicrobium sp. BvORR106]|uniref:hypothetical protein n=1 Tax=Verrucomicrobium sp. BvORR106 TaxID=1403819 RepID=UPI00056F7448|nr:hypothetical protein [Verrucomicrobium sp. BvORR106]